MDHGKTRAAIGQYAEQLAAEYLNRQGLQLLERNYRCRGGEIDLVMRDSGNRGKMLVFVEVRYRTSDLYGGAVASVDRRKQQRLLHAAQHYLQQRRIVDQACRFDVVAISPSSNGMNEFQWITNAIELD